MVYLHKTKLYIDDDDFEWSEDECERSDHESSDEVSEEMQLACSSPPAKRLDEANVSLIEDKEVRSIVEMTNEREKQVFTGKGKKFMYPTEWKQDTGCGKLRLNIHLKLDGIFFRILAMILVIVDVCMVLTSVFKANSNITATRIIGVIIVTYFLLELILRVFAWGKTFFKDWLEVLDGVVIIIAFAVTVVIESLNLLDENVKYAALVVVLRLVRFVLYIRILFHTGEAIYMALRYKATQSKKRYVQDGFDLDLTYITDKVIAMSFPSSGISEIRNLTKVDVELALRNPRDEVARFFNEKYPDGHYRIYNLCKERGYDTSVFNDQVSRYKIDDHNVPKMSELVEFCKDVEEYMQKSPDNVISVHCKGGKGRTGCCIASWLLYSGQFKTAKTALDYFGGRRMDVAKGVKFQGVETPSQKRYVSYLEMLMKMGGKMPDSPKQLLVKSVEVKGLEESAYNDLRMEVVSDGVVVKKVELKQTKKNERKKRRVLVNFTEEDNIRVAGDVKFRFKSNALGKDYDNCAFFFWLHTTFIKNNKFEAGRYKIGNANKPKHNDKYNEEFNVKLVFADPNKTTATKTKKKNDTVINMEPVINFKPEQQGGNALDGEIDASNGKIPDSADTRLQSESADVAICGESENANDTFIVEPAAADSVFYDENHDSAINVETEVAESAVIGKNNMVDSDVIVCDTTYVVSVSSVTDSEVGNMAGGNIDVTIA